MLSLTHIEELMLDRETSVEFKEAKRTFHLDKLCDYVVAMANDGGGHLVLGVSDKIPRQVVGTVAIREPKKTERKILDVLSFRVNIESARLDGQRIVVVEIPPRPRGYPLHHNGRYLTRSDDSLVPMTATELAGILDETKQDFTAQACSGTSIDDIDEVALDLFRARWAAKASGDVKASIERSTAEEILQKAELVVGTEATYAALILMGKADSLAKYLPQAEVVFEYRSTFQPGPAQHRLEFRRGFLQFNEDLWGAIDSRNERQNYQEGMFVHEIRTFNERVVREVVANAVCHRDYENPASVFIRQYPRVLQVESPGGLPLGVTFDNFLSRTVPRNRRVAENLGRCGIVERAGQGISLMYQESLLEGKNEPDFSATDANRVVVRLDGEIEDPKFVRFIQDVSAELGKMLTVEDLIVASRVYRNRSIGSRFDQRIPGLVEAGILERPGGPRSKKLILSERFYRHLGKAGVYTRERGLQRSTEKELLVSHLKRARREGVKLEELAQVLPQRNRKHVSKLMQELKAEGRAFVEGKTRAARWFPAE